MCKAGLGLRTPQPAHLVGGMEFVPSSIGQSIVMVCLIENPGKKRLPLRLPADEVTEQSVKEWSIRSELLLRGSARGKV
jgi:hypothetical protein